MPRRWSYYEKSLEIKRKIGDVKGEGYALNNLGNVYMAGASMPRRWSITRSPWR